MTSRKMCKLSWPPQVTVLKASGEWGRYLRCKQARNLRVWGLSGQLGYTVTLVWNPTRVLDVCLQPLDSLKVRLHGTILTTMRCRCSIHDTWHPIKGTLGGNRKWPTCVTIRQSSDFCSCSHCLCTRPLLEQSSFDGSFVCVMYIHTCV